MSTASISGYLTPTSTVVSTIPAITLPNDGTIAIGTGGITLPAGTYFINYTLEFPTTIVQSQINFVDLYTINSATATTINTTGLLNAVVTVAGASDILIATGTYILTLTALTTLSFSLRSKYVAGTVTCNAFDYIYVRN